MPGFWKWCVRNVAALGAVYSLVLGQWGGLDWSVALSAAAVCGLIARLGDWRYIAALEAAQAITRDSRIVQFPARGANHHDRAA